MSARVGFDSLSQPECLGCFPTIVGGKDRGRVSTSKDPVWWSRARESFAPSPPRRILPHHCCPPPLHVSPPHCMPSTSKSPLPSRLCPSNTSPPHRTQSHCTPPHSPLLIPLATPLANPVLYHPPTPTLPRLFATCGGVRSRTRARSAC